MSFYFIKQMIEKARRSIYRKVSTNKKLTVPFVGEGILNRRFLSDNPIAYKDAIEAAENYVFKLQDGHVEWLRRKPFDPTPGNPQYYRLMYDLMNVLQAMHLPAHGKVLEIGSGPGWVTEILLMLGYSVDALEPSADLVEIAEARCAGLSPHYRQKEPLDVRHHKSTLEEVTLEENHFDAILFFDVLHHVVHEAAAFEKSFRFLKPGGCIGIVESAWHPTFKDLEAEMRAEMAEYGTLENPFSVEYLHALLENYGFIHARRYIGINGYFTQDDLHRWLQSAGGAAFARSNNLTARKPTTEETIYPACSVSTSRTDAEIVLVSGHIDEETFKAALTVDIKNTGETLFDCRPFVAGQVTFALRLGAPGSDAFSECQQRHPLARTLVPGAQARETMTFSLPPGAGLDGWELDVVAEGLFWFSTKSMQTCAVPVLRRDVGVAPGPG